MFQASNKIDDFSKIEIDECDQYNNFMSYAVTEKPSGQFPEKENFKSKFMVWMENNMASIDGVDVKFMDDSMKNKFLWDQKTKAWELEFLG